LSSSFSFFNPSTSWVTTPIAFLWASWLYFPKKGKKNIPKRGKRISPKGEKNIPKKGFKVFRK